MVLEVAAALVQALISRYADMIHHSDKISSATSVAQSLRLLVTGRGAAPSLELLTVAGLSWLHSTTIYMTKPRITVFVTTSY